MVDAKAKRISWEKSFPVAVAFLLLLLLVFVFLLPRSVYACGGSSGGCSVCDWDCKVVPLQTQTMDVTGADEDRIPTQVKDTTPYECYINHANSCCTAEEKETLCKPISDSSSSFSRSYRVETDGRQVIIVTLVSSFKCGDKVALASAFQKEFVDCRWLKTARDNAKAAREAACNDETKEAAEAAKGAECKPKKDAMDAAKSEVDETTKSIAWDQSSLNDEKQKLEGMRSSLAALKESYAKHQEDIEEKKAAWDEAESELADSRAEDTTCWEKGMIKTAGPIGAIYNLVGVLTGHWGNAWGLIPGVGEVIDVAESCADVEDSKAKVKEAEDAAARAEQSYLDEVSMVEAYGEAASIKEYETEKIPQSEAKIPELETKITELQKTEKTLKEAYDNAAKAYDSCLGINCDDAEQKEQDARAAYLACTQTQTF